MIGLTGGIACGKSTVGRMLQELGAEVVDADQLAREVVAPGTPALAEVALAFGAEVLGPDGALDRARLAALIFTDPERRRTLEQILHPPIAELARRRLLEAAARSPLAVYQAPLIFEAGRRDEFAGIVLADCRPEIQLARLRARDHLSEAEARARVKAQIAPEERLRLATWVLDNSGTLEDTRAQVRRLWEGPLAELRSRRPGPPQPALS